MLTPAQLAAPGNEHSHQVAVLAWSVINLPRYPCLKWLFAIPNGGTRSRSQGGRLKAEGVKAGVADLMLPVPVGRYHGLFIEMKRQNGTEADVSPKQREFLLFVQAQGYRVQVCYGWEQAVAVIERYLCGAC